MKEKDKKGTQLNSREKIMKRKLFVQIVVLLSITFLSVPSFCFFSSTVDESGKEFVYKNDIKIITGQSTKKDILNAYGQPTEERIIGRYQVLRYYYVRKSLKHGRAIGLGLLSAVTGGLSDLAADSGVKDSDMQVEGQEMVAYVDIMSGKIKDFYYHDESTLTGNDESESLLLKAMAAQKEGNKAKEAREMLEKSVALNPTNHRALNSLAWSLIDTNEDVDRGVVLAQKAVDIFPDSPFNNGTLGVGYMKKNDLDNAEKYLDIAVKLYPVYAPTAQAAYQNDLAYLNSVKSMKSLK